MRRPWIIVALGLAASLTSCTEVIRQYRADSTGKLRHARTFVPEWGPIGKHVSYTLNGATFSYDLSSVGGDVRGHRRPPPQLGTDEDFVPFIAGSDRSLLEAAFDAPGASWFSGSIKVLGRERSGSSDILGELRARGISKSHFADSPTREYRFINGRRWLVTTAFEDGDRTLPRGCVFWTIENGFLVTFNVNFASAPQDPEWRRKRLGTLEKLVSRFEMRKNV